MYYDLVESGKRIKALRKGTWAYTGTACGAVRCLPQTPLHELKPATEVSLLIWQSNWLCALRQPLITYF